VKPIKAAYALLIASAVCVAVVGAVGWFLFAYPEVRQGAPRNQHINVPIVEKRVRIGMTLRQVEAVLNLPPGATNSLIRTRHGRREVEIVGSSPPWRRLPPGYHTIRLEIDRTGRVKGGYGIWYDADCDDDMSLQLSQ
jgi:hypothetical protein